mmetsp:Transcript_17873/g.30364  ORF Transcript_17873/g.30364 Transcript_17873/m.30364 type:complete len:244 (+) Transcript_17873:2142-2873(+)
MATSKRRLVQFIMQQREVVMCINPVLFCLIQLITFNLVLETMLKTFQVSPKDIDAVQKIIYQFIFPFLVSISVLVFSGIYVVTTVQDREEKLRFLLNFAGMKPFSYYLGMLASEFVIFMVPNIFLILLAGVLGIEVFFKQGWYILLAFILYSFPFILTNYVIGFLFSRAETAFKYQVLPLVGFAYIPGIIYGIAFPPDSGAPPSPDNTFNSTVTPLDYIIPMSSFLQCLVRTMYGSFIVAQDG